MKLRQSPLGLRQARAFLRLMTHQAAELEFDAQGRIRIPQYLREFAGLKKEVVVAGSLNRVEIWDRQIYERYIYKIEKQGEQIAESVSKLGI